MKKSDLITMLVMLVSTVITFFISETLLSPDVFSNLNFVVKEGLHFAVIAFICILFLVVSTYKISRLKDELSTTVIFKNVLIMLPLLALLLSFLLGTLFQFLYNLQIDKHIKQDNFIVAVDNSGSMGNTDPNYQRFDALESLLNIVEPKQQFGVYVFSTDTENIFPLRKINKGEIKNYMNEILQHAYSEGGTNAMGVLEHIAGDIQADNITGNTTIALISDGECEIDINTLNRINRLNITVNTIQVSQEGNFDSLELIAEHTGGKFYTIDDISDFTMVLEEIYKQPSFLLTGKRAEPLIFSFKHTLLRVLFIFILSLLIKSFQVLTIDLSRIRKNIIFQSVIFSIIAAAAVETLFLFTDFSESIVRFIMTLFINILFVSFLQKKYYTGEINNSIFGKPTSLDLNGQTKDNSDKVFK